MGIVLKACGGACPAQRFNRETRAPWPSDKTDPPARFNIIQRRVKLFLRQLARKIDHKDVVDHVCEEGQMSGRYIFMAVMSCAIATLGLLLSSPAVIIGAMLISP